MSSFEELRDQWIHDHVPSATLSLHYVFEAAENRIAALEAELAEARATYRQHYVDWETAAVKSEALLVSQMEANFAALEAEAAEKARLAKEEADRELKGKAIEQKREVAAAKAEKDHAAAEKELATLEQGLVTLRKALSAAADNQKETQ